MILARKATRTLRPERAESSEPCTGGPIDRSRARPGPDGQVRRFDWLEGATGVRLLVATCYGLEAVRVAGEIDEASIDAIEAILLEILQRSPSRVQLDLSGVLFVDDTGHQMIARASEYARAHRVALQIVRPHRYRGQGADGLLV